MASAITYHPPLAPTEIQRQIPSVGAVCGKVARTALCGGREVTCVPTATAGTNLRQTPRLGAPLPTRRCPMCIPNAWAMRARTIAIGMETFECAHRPPYRHINDCRCHHVWVSAQRL